MGILNSQLGKRLLGLEDATKQNILGTKFQMSQSILSCGEHSLVGWMDLAPRRPALWGMAQHRTHLVYLVLCLSRHGWKCWVAAPSYPNNACVNSRAQTTTEPNTTEPNSGHEASG